MKTERAIQRKVLTPYETSVVEKINSRIEFLDFIKKGIQFYGSEKYENEISGLKLEKQFEAEPIIKVPYNIDKQNEITNQARRIIDACISQSHNSSISVDDLIFSEKRGDFTDLKHVAYNMLCRYSALTPTQVSKIFNRSRQGIHTGLNRLKISLNKNSDKKFNELFYKVNSHIVQNLSLKDKFTVRDEEKREPQNDNYDFDELLNRITNILYGNKIKKFTPKQISEYSYDYNDNNFINALIIAVTKTNINRAYIMYYFNITLKQYNTIKPTHTRRMNNSLSYKRKYNSIERKVINDRIFISKSRKLEKIK